MEKRKHACLVKTRDFPTLPNLWMLCFDDFEIHYIGGLGVIFEFKSKEACKNFLASVVMNHWISEKHYWDRDFIPLEKLVWVNVEGLPLRKRREKSS